MLKLTLRQKITLWLGRHRRSLVLTSTGVTALALTLVYNAQISQHNGLISLLTLFQLGVGIVFVLLVIILSD